MKFDCISLFIACFTAEDDGYCIKRVMLWKPKPTFSRIKCLFMPFNYTDMNNLYISIQLQINYAAKGATPLFDPSSSFLRQGLIGLFVAFIVLFIIGSACHFYRKRFKRSVEIKPGEPFSFNFHIFQKSFTRLRMNVKEHNFVN